MIPVMGMYVLLTVGNGIITPIYFNDKVECGKVAQTIRREGHGANVVGDCSPTGSLHEVKK